MRMQDEKIKANRLRHGHSQLSILSALFKQTHPPCGGDEKAEREEKACFSPTEVSTTAAEYQCELFYTLCRDSPALSAAHSVTALLPGLQTLSCNCKYTLSEVC